MAFSGHCASSSRSLVSASGVALQAQETRLVRSRCLSSDFRISGGTLRASCLKFRQPTCCTQGIIPQALGAWLVLTSHHAKSSRSPVGEHKVHTQVPRVWLARLRHLASSAAILGGVAPHDPGGAQGIALQAQGSWVARSGSLASTSCSLGCALRESSLKHKKP
uniref:Uncharacterized protein n=1 Tax=Solanum lycopersicum TaxID=4081 RepID=A0A3Q7HNQ2_SOLLC